MTDPPWSGDACSLVEAYRRGEHSPADELDGLPRGDRCQSISTPSRTSTASRRSQRRQWPTSPSRSAACRSASRSSTRWQVGPTRTLRCCSPTASRRRHRRRARIRDAGGAVLVGQTTASEFGGVNFTRTVINGTTHNPWQRGRTPGGSSGGSAAAVAGGLVTLATGGDGGGSIRIPAGFTRPRRTEGDIRPDPAHPRCRVRAMTVTVGCLSRSVRDTARWFDVCNGHDPREPLSLPRVDGWEAGLGTHLDRSAACGSRSFPTGAAPSSRPWCGRCSRRPPTP